MQNKLNLKTKLEMPTKHGISCQMPCGAKADFYYGEKSRTVQCQECSRNDTARPNPDYRFVGEMRGIRYYTNTIIMKTKGSCPK